MTIDYKYDVFISYRRAGRASKWVEEHFAPTLEDCLAMELNEPRVYFDGRLEIGTTWPIDLASALASSRMLIVLWSKNYLESDWCSLELAHMLTRENNHGFRTGNRPGGLIILCVIHDGIDSDFPYPLGAIQRIQLGDYFNTRMRKDSDKAEELEDTLRTQAPILAETIRQAPTWNPAWSTQAADQFYQKFRARSAASQDIPPTFVAK